MKKNILVTASTFPRWINDTEPRFILDYCIGLSKYYNVTVLVPAAIGAVDEEVLEGVHVIRYHYFPLHSFETLCYPGAIVPRIKEKKVRALLVPFLLLSLYLKLNKICGSYDLVHSHWFIPQGIVQAFIKKKPYFVTGHGGDVGELNTGIFHFLKQRCIKHAAGISVVSAHLKQLLEGKYSLTNKSISILPMGCNTSYFSPLARKEHFFDEYFHATSSSKKTILFVGRLAEKKGVRYLIDAMEKVDARLVIVGKGPLEEMLKAQVASKAILKDKIAFLGPKNHTELRTVYASADFFAAPSITAKNGDVEGFGLVILEAMASGLPVVASRSGGICDIIQNEKNGLLVEEKNVDELASQFNRLLADSLLYAHMKEASLSTAAEYDYSKIAQSYATLFDDILS